MASAVAACGGSGSVGSPAVPASIGPDTPRLAAKELEFDRTELRLPANRAFSLFFDNQVAWPHNVSLTDESGTTVFTGEVFTGPGSRLYAVPALKPGGYLLICDVHPQMKVAATAQ
jgi:hypothetical protein